MSSCSVIAGEVKAFNFFISHLNGLFKRAISAKIKFGVIMSKSNLPFSCRLIKANARNAGSIVDIEAKVLPVLSVGGVSEICPPIIRSVSINMIYAVFRIRSIHIKKCKPVRRVKLAIYCYGCISGAFTYTPSKIASLFIRILVGFNPCKYPSNRVIIKDGFKVLIGDHFKPHNYRLSIGFNASR